VWKAPFERVIKVATAVWLLQFRLGDRFMKFLLCVLFLSTGFAQTGTPPPAEPAPPPSNQAQDKPPANAAGQSRDRSVIKPKPAGEAIKPKDYSDATGYWHPFARMGKYTLMDQKAIWTSPFHTSKKDVKWWLIFGGATGGLIAADKYVSKNAPNPPWLDHLGNSVSYLGEPYTLLPIAAGFYFGGTKFGSDHFREAGLLSFEALADVTVIELALKSVFDRQRPLEGAGNGEFWASTSSRWNSSFPSGHAIETMALASVFAHEYPHKLWVQILAYSYAGGVIGARLAANKHFPGDVMAGGAIGWFVGDYVYGKRHNPALDKKPTVTRDILDHVRIGGGFLASPAYPPM
jgi:membrane-associated phospholipid phosphatase